MLFRRIICRTTAYSSEVFISLVVDNEHFSFKWLPNAFARAFKLCLLKGNNVRKYINVKYTSMEIKNLHFDYQKYSERQYFRSKYYNLVYLFYRLLYF